MVLISSSVYAAVGCVRNTDLSTIYLDKAGSNYKHNGAFTTLAAECNWISTGGGPCNITGPGAGAGFLAESTSYECDLDTNTLFILTGSLGLGVFVIRKKRDTNFIFGSK